jgi:glycosyltransferase involved in cell wall biosynthesis
MRYLFIHPVFPGQFHRVMQQLAAQPGNEVVHLSRQSALESVPGVRKIRFTVPEGAAPTGHPYVHKLEEAVIQGQAVARVASELKRKGFVPDLIYGYAGWGQIMFIKDIYPNVPLVGYFEWFLNAYGSEYNFDPAYPLAPEHQLYLRAANSPMLLDLQSCNHGITPTRWQQHQFPEEFRHKLTVLHDGVDTDRFRPNADAGLNIPGVSLPPGTPLVTYSTRGMEPFRGFPQFMRALAELQARRPDCHAVIVGTDNVYYSKALPDGRTYKQQLLEELSGRLDLSRIHFTGWLDTPHYLQVLQASTAHVYLTRPYVLSWSLMEAMAAGCLIIGSDTAPLQEVIHDGENGLLTDFFDHHALADRLEEALHQPERFRTLRENARQTVMQRYRLDKLLDAHVRLLEHWAAEPIHPAFHPDH